MDTDATDPHVADRTTDRGLTARVTEYDDAPDECTIYPAGADPGTALTTWVVAEEGSFVTLAGMR
jgi:hypothetical protein